MMKMKAKITGFDSVQEFHPGAVDLLKIYSDICASVVTFYLGKSLWLLSFQNLRVKLWRMVIVSLKMKEKM